VTLPSKIQDQLKAWKVEQSRQRLAAVAWEDFDLVVTNEIGQSPDYSAMLRRFHAASRKAGLPEVGFHSFRHGVASGLLASGVPVNEVAAILGHQSATTLLKVYAHVLPGRLDQAAAKLNQGLIGL
jgi:integrase